MQEAARQRRQCSSKIYERTASSATPPAPLPSLIRKGPWQNPVVLVGPGPCPHRPLKRSASRRQTGCHRASCLTWDLSRQDSVLHVKAGAAASVQSASMRCTGLSSVKAAKGVRSLHLRLEETPMGRFCLLTSTEARLWRPLPCKPCPNSLLLFKYYQWSRERPGRPACIALRIRRPPEDLLHPFHNDDRAQGRRRTCAAHEPIAGATENGACTRHRTGFTRKGRRPAHLSRPHQPAPRPGVRGLRDARTWAFLRIVDAKPSAGWVGLRRQHGPQLGPGPSPRAENTPSAGS